MQTYHSKETVKARKVTDKDGETVVTADGIFTANKGDYVVDDRVTEEVNGVDTIVSGGIRVVEAEVFEAKWKGAGGPGRGNGEATATRKEAATAPKKTSAGTSAADRVKASQKRS